MTPNRKSQSQRPQQKKATTAKPPQTKPKEIDFNERAGVVDQSANDRNSVEEKLLEILGDSQHAMLKIISEKTTPKEESSWVDRFISSVKTYIIITVSNIIIFAIFDIANPGSYIPSEMQAMILAQLGKALDIAKALLKS
jgi:hypothetical protein